MPCRIAVIENGVVKNIIIHEENFVPDNVNTVCVDGMHVNLGWLYENGVFTPVEKPRKLSYSTLLDRVSDSNLAELSVALNNLNFRKLEKIKLNGVYSDDTEITNLLTSIGEDPNHIFGL